MLNLVRPLLLTVFLAAAPYAHASDEGALAMVAWWQRDYERARALALPAANQGDPSAQWVLGRLYLAGLGLPKDPEAGQRWMQRSAESGFAEAQFDLGNLYFADPSRLKMAEAARWYEMAADQGIVDAQARVAAMYATGNGIPRDDERAVRWHRKAAEQGHLRSAHNLGLSYLEGRGTRKDERIGLDWLRNAAVAGWANSQIKLASVYSDGVVVPKDDQHAAYWIARAAERGSGVAQYDLSTRYLSAEGVAKDPARAYFWLLLTAANGWLADKPDLRAELATTRDKTGRELSADQRSQIQTLVSQWKPTSGPIERAYTPGEPPERIAVTRPAPNRPPESRKGSGFFVSSNRLVTNHHVVDGCRSILVQERPAELVISDARADLALIAVSDTSATVASIRLGHADLGEQVAVGGFPLQGLLTGFNVTTGNVSGVVGLQGDARMLQVSAPVQAGNSGGPLLDSAANVIGIVVSKLDAAWVQRIAGDTPQNVNFAINVNTLASFLDANGVDFRTSPRKGARVALQPQEIAKRAQSFTRPVTCLR